MVGADYFDRNLNCLAMDGRLVIIAFLGGFEVAKARPAPGDDPPPDGDRQHHAAAHHGAEGRDRAHGAAREGLAAARSRHGRARRSSKVFPLTEAAAAHALMESSAHIGKIMLKVAD